MYSMVVLNIHRCARLQYCNTFHISTISVRMFCAGLSTAGNGGAHKDRGV